MSGRGGVGTQQYGWRGGRGGRGSGGGLGTNWYSGHGGWAGAGGGGGGGRRPRRGDDGPMGHRWEDSRRDGRVQKNTDRGSGRGRGRGVRGRGGQQAGVGPGKANELHTWDSGKTFQKREAGPREQAEGVNYDSLIMNKFGAKDAPLIEVGALAVEGGQRRRLELSQARQYEAADVKEGNFVGINLDARNAHSMLSRADRTQPQGTRWNVRLQAVSPADAAASSEVIKGRFLGALVTKGDPFKPFPDEDEEMEDEKDSTPNETMLQQHREENAHDMNREDAADRPKKRPAHF